MTDPYALGFLEGVAVATEIIRKHLRGAGREMPLSGPETALGAPNGSGVASVDPEPRDAPREATDGEDRESPFIDEYPRPMTVWHPPTVGFYRIPDETD